MANYDPLTYGQLEYLLTELGYRLTPTPIEGGRLWTYPEFDALQFLADAPEMKTAPSYELITIRKVSVEKGIIEADDFDSLLERARRHVPESSESLDAA